MLDRVSSTAPGSCALAWAHEGPGRTVAGSFGGDGRELCSAAARAGCHRLHAGVIAKERRKQEVCTVLYYPRREQMKYEKSSSNLQCRSAPDCIRHACRHPKNTGCRPGTQ